MLSLFPGDALLDLHCSHLHLVLGAICLQSGLQQVKFMLSWIEVRWLTWPVKKIPLLPENVLGCLDYMFLIILLLHDESSSNQFWWICLHLSRQAVSVYLLSASFCCYQQWHHQWTSEPVPVVAIHAQTITLSPPCLTDEVVCFGSWAVPFFLHTYLFPILWYRLIFVWYIHNTLFHNCSSLPSCDEPSEVILA